MSFLNLFCHLARIFVSIVVVGPIRHVRSLTHAFIEIRILFEIGIDGTDIEMCAADGNPFI